MIYPLHNHVSVFNVGMVLDGAILLRHAGGSRVNAPFLCV